MVPERRAMLRLELACPAAVQQLLVLVLPAEAPPQPAPLA
jgi:hypothetical protein